MIFDVLRRETGLNLYATIVDPHSGLFWNKTQKKWTNTGSFAFDFAIPMPETPASSGAYPIPVPDGFTSSHTVNITVHEQGGASPDASDELVFGGKFPFGSTFGF